MKKQFASHRSNVVNYAVVGLGYIAQIATLPAFHNAQKNSRLTAIVSGDPRKRWELGRRYRVSAYSYEEYAKCLRSGDIHAVYIALPNSMHREFAVKAMQEGVHVLCEKPLAVTEGDCREMIEVARAHHVKLMTAYRLHFEKANLRALEITRSRKLGDLRAFTSTFTMQVKQGDIRVRSSLGGGTLYDIGIYCINAARTLFEGDPYEVFAMREKGKDRKFREVEEMTSAILRFPGDRLASFTCSFGASDVSSYRLVGTKGSLCVDPAYEFAGELRLCANIAGRRKTMTYSRRDQFGPELIYFSDCILKNREPEPSGIEGLEDVRVIQALYHSAAIGRSVALAGVNEPRPRRTQEIHRPPIRKRQLLHASSPHPEGDD